MIDVIREAHAKRYKAPEGDANKDSILISDSWMTELTKHPYFSSKRLPIITYRETGHWDISHEGEGKDSQRAQKQDSAPHLEEAGVPDKLSRGSKARWQSIRKEEESWWRTVSGNR
jgi:hypothetical protein